MRVPSGLLRRLLAVAVAVVTAASGAAQGFAYRTFDAGLGSVTGANGVAVADYDRDGDLDVYVVVRAAYDAGDPRTWSRLFANDGTGTFSDRTVEAGVAGTAGVSLPSTGGNGAKLGAATLVDVAGPMEVAARDAGRGLAVFDADGDGRLDVLVANVSRSRHFYGNRAAAWTWLAVALEGAGANRDGLGAVVEVEAGGRRWVRFHHGAPFLGQSLTPVHVGLGVAEAVDRVVVRWPGGDVDEVTGLAVGQTIRVGQGIGLIEGRSVAVGDAPAGMPSVRVLGVHPNPSGRSVQVRVEPGQPGLLDLVVIDVLGRTVWRLCQSVTAGTTDVVWEGADGAGRRVAPGGYFVTATVAEVRSAPVPLVMAR